MSQTYFIHDNGDRPFKVKIIATHRVNVYEKIDEISDLINVYSNKPFLSLYATKVFIGRSSRNRMTEFNEGHGPRFDGNSILLHIKNLEYVFIGEKIYSFTAHNKIKKFISHVGNSDVPYPFAIDENDHYYFLINESVILHVPERYRKSPYRYYYDQCLLTDDIGYIPPRKASNSDFVKIREFYVDKNQYTMTFNVDYLEDFVNEKDIEIVSDDGTRRSISRDEYMKIMREYGEYIGVSKIQDIRVLKERLW